MCRIMSKKINVPLSKEKRILIFPNFRIYDKLRLSCWSPIDISRNIGRSIKFRSQRPAYDSEAGGGPSPTCDAGFALGARRRFRVHQQREERRPGKNTAVYATCPRDTNEAINT